MDSWFWTALMFTILVVPVIVLFGYAVVDVVQRHGVGSVVKLLWLVAFCVLPIVGPLVYLVIRPPGIRAQEEHLAGDESTRVAELMSLSNLHDQGKLTDEEFRQVKAASIGGYENSPGSVREQRGGQLL
jgi:hypothetical protein